MMKRLEVIAREGNTLGILDQRLQEEYAGGGDRSDRRRRLRGRGADGRRAARVSANLRRSAAAARARADLAARARRQQHERVYPLRGWRHVSPDVDRGG